MRMRPTSHKNHVAKHNVKNSESLGERECRSFELFWMWVLIARQQIKGGLNHLPQFLHQHNVQVTYTQGVSYAPLPP